MQISNAGLPNARMLGRCRPRGDASTGHRHRLGPWGCSVGTGSETRVIVLAEKCPA